jgi:hypothetical protein
MPASIAGVYKALKPKKLNTANQQSLQWQRSSEVS